MALYYIGQDVALSVSPTDDTGQSATPTTIALTVTDPAGNAVTASTPTLIYSGQYMSVVPTVALAGTYLVRWVAGGTGWNFVFEDEFEVRPQSQPQVVDLASVKQQLNMTNDDTQDTEMQGFITAATELIRDMCGPMFPETHTQTFTGGMSTFVPDWLPLLSVTSVTEYYGLSAFPITNQPLGAQSNAFGYTLDLTTGQITRRTFGGEPALWALGYKNVQIVYVAGRAAVPFAVRLAALRLIQHWWTQFKQARVRPGSRGLDSGEESTPMGFAVPDAVVELLSPWRRPPGMA